MKNIIVVASLLRISFFVEGQVGKVFFRPQKKWKDGFWLWHIGFAVGKSTRQVNDWYYMKKNKRARAVRKKKLQVKQELKLFLKG